MAFDAARQYLARVLAWPQATDEPAYANVHWTVQKPDRPRPLWSGRAVRSVGEAIKALEFALKSSDTRDVYVCLSTQRQAEEKISKNNWKYHLPVRSQANAVALKSLFLDIDLKGGEHGYNTVEEAAGALGEFLGATGMPKPTLVVNSGGGFHVYWTLTDPLLPAQWTPLAIALAEATKKHGLKCDTQCTVDSARVLRIPDTFNRKQDPARPVTLVGNPIPTDYLLERIEKVLEPYKTITPSNALALPPKTPITGDDDLSAGIDRGNAAPIPFRALAKACPFIATAIVDGGKNYTNPLWNLTTLVASFTQEGRQAAHWMADKHPGYTAESTDELYDRKVREREQKGLGWPACQTISAQGCKACQACPHFGQGKSPLHFAERPPIQVLAAQSAPMPAASGDLPAGYARLADGRIGQLVKSTASGAVELVPICQRPMTDEWVERDGDGYILHFDTKLERGQVKRVAFSMKYNNTTEMRTMLQEQGIFIESGFKNVNRIGDFFMAWVTKLLETRDSIYSEAFGWSVDKNLGLVDGFAYAGKLWTPSGPKLAAPPKDARYTGWYTPRGNPKIWREAVKLITDQERPALNSIVASAFAAPLMRFTGQMGVLYSLISESGSGKTTAVRTALAVWADPRRALDQVSTTQNSVLQKIGIVRSLPLYWDELKTDDQTKKFGEFMFQMCGGGDKGRLNRNIQQRERNTWETLLVSASNKSVREVVDNLTKGSDAGVLRIFEVNVPPYESDGPGRIDSSEASRLNALLDDSFGHIGLEYGQWLGQNHQKIYDEVGDFGKALNAEVKAPTEERFWGALITAICLGARYATSLGYADLDEEGIKQFLIDELSQQRIDRKERPDNMDQGINVLSVLSQFIAEKRARNTLWTNRINIGAGKPAYGSIKIVGDASRLDTIQVQIGVEDNMMRISRAAMAHWLARNDQPRCSFLDKLRKEFDMKQVVGHLGSGTGPTTKGGKETLYELNLACHPDLDFLSQ